MHRLDGKSILIVGGTAGLGLSASLACAAEGARLVVIGRDDDSLEAARGLLGGRAEIIAGDATDPGLADRAIAAAVSRFGRLDALYHVAGGSGRRMGDGPLHEITDSGWAATMNLNLTSLFNSNRAAVRQFLSQGGGGSVLNIASVLGWSPSPVHFATHAYAAAKSAVVGLCRSCASYYAAQSIRFNVVAPGLVKTPMAERASGNPAIQQYITRKQPLDGGRSGTPADFDSAVVFFLGDESRFVTGQVLSIDGGWEVSEGAS